MWSVGARARALLALVFRAKEAFCFDGEPSSTFQSSVFAVLVPVRPIHRQGKFLTAGKVGVQPLFNLPGHAWFSAKLAVADKGATNKAHEFTLSRPNV